MGLIAIPQELRIVHYDPLELMPHKQYVHKGELTAAVTVYNHSFSWALNVLVKEEADEEAKRKILLFLNRFQGETNFCNLPLNLPAPTIATPRVVSSPTIIAATNELQITVNNAGILEGQWVKVGTRLYQVVSAPTGKLNLIPGVMPPTGTLIAGTHMQARPEGGGIRSKITAHWLGPVRQRFVEHIS